MRQTEGAARQIVFLPVSEIDPNSAQPRRRYDPQSLRALADSVSRYGILQPLTVRRADGRYTLVAGERRLRAARIAGLGEVPCIVRSESDFGSGLNALVETLRRQDLNYIDEARGIASLMAQYGLSQAQASRKLGKSQSAVANKLRLLRHTPAVLQALRENGLTERHARALLRVEDENDQLALIRRIADEGWSVARLEQTLDREQAVKQRSILHRVTVRDARLLLGAVERALRTARSAGVAAQYGSEETDREIVLTIHVPK